MKLEQLIDLWRTKSEFSDIKLNDRGVYRVKIGEDYYLSLEEAPDQNGFYLYAVLRRIPSGTGNEWAVEALSGNLFGKETGKNSLGYDPITQTLVLFKYLSHETTDFQTFKDHMEEFSAYQRYWENKVNTFKKDPKDECKHSMSDSLKESISQKKSDIFFA